MKLPAALIAAILLALPSAARAQGSTLGQGLQGHWKFDEATGSTATDSSGLGRTATWTGGVSATAPLNPGIPFANPNCIVLDGSSGHVKLADAEALNITGDITIAFWMHPTATKTNWQRIVGKGSSNSTRTYGVFRHPDNQLLFQIINSGGVGFGIMSPGPVPNDTWTHVAATISGTSGVLYVNGASVATGSRDFTPDPCPEPVSFGYDPNASGTSAHTHFPGRLDEIRIYNRGLSPAEVAALAAGGTHDQIADPSGLKQVDAATMTEIPAGATLTQDSMTARATASSTSGAQVRLAIEVRPVDTAFSGVATATGSPVASGTPASVTVTGLTAGTDYHWQLRALDANNLASAWISYGGNAESAADFKTAAPSGTPEAADIAQVRPATLAPIAAGAVLTDADLVRIQSLLTDPNNGKVRLQVEIVAATAAFTDSATLESAAVDSGSTASIEFRLAPGSYRWQGRAVNQWGAAGPWTAKGGMPDLEIEGIGSRGNACGLTAGGAGGFALLLAALLLRRK